MYVILAGAVVIMFVVVMRTRSVLQNIRDEVEVIQGWTGRHGSQVPPELMDRLGHLADLCDIPVLPQELADAGSFDE